MKTDVSTRRKIIWKKIRGFRSVTATLIATALGAGFSPVAPGTMGTLMGMPLAYATRDVSGLARVGFWIFLTFIGTWSAKVFDEMMETNDNQGIVIDEVIGLGIASWTAGPHLKNWFVAFVLFRIFDILKPPPVRGVDRWSKKQASPWWGGFGVIADDMLAGFEALGVILILQWFKVLPGF